MGTTMVMVVVVVVVLLLRLQRCVITNRGRVMTGREQVMK